MANNFWTAVSGASAQSQAVDVVANNLANMDTSGFKKDIPTFKEYLTHLEREPAALGAQPGVPKDKDLYPLDGREQSYVVIDSTYSSFKPGTFRVTEQPLDLAIDGTGFFEVLTPEGVRFTRAGSFKQNSEGFLTTTDGYPVLAAQAAGIAGQQTEAANDPATRKINIRDLTVTPTITQEGELYAGDQKIAQIKVTEFIDPKALRKVGGVLFNNADPANIKTEVPRSRVRQGVIEASNVNPVEEMTKLIQASRLYEQGLKAVKVHDEMMGKESNDIGKF